MTAAMPAADRPKPVTEPRPATRTARSAGPATPTARSAASAVAAVILGTLGAGMLLVAGFALPFAVVALDRGGFAVDAIQRSQLDVLLAAGPAITLAGLAQVVAAVGIVVRPSWGRPFAMAVAIGGAAIALAVIAAIVLGHDPFATQGRPASAADGIGIMAVGAFVYVASAVAVAVGGRREDGARYQG